VKPFELALMKNAAALALPLAFVAVCARIAHLPSRRQARPIRR
jgi:hypothetical protein